jgi:tryptophanyl-tRNA synthetase
LTSAKEKKGRVLSGMRPTGRLHIGHYFGALQNWIRLQDEYECFYFVADWHALTTDYADASQIAQNTIEIATDWLAAGLDPKKCVLFVQSQVPEHAELHLLLSMVTPLGWLERVPTYKEQLENIKDKDLHTYGFLGYPLLQTADIVMYGAPEKPLFVPVGEDQVAHVEMAREVVRRFNFLFGLKNKPELYADSPEAQAARDKVFFELPATSLSHSTGEAPRIRYSDAVGELGVQNFLDKIGFARKYFTFQEVLHEPKHFLTETPRIPGTDGRKMSKSYNNFISLSEDDESIRAKTKVMMTDPARKRRTDKGNPDVCPVFSWHKLFSTQETIAWADHGCRTAEIGCIECKAATADHLIKWIEPVRARRKDYEAHPENVLKILDEGSARAREAAGQTMARVREAVFGKDAQAGVPALPK